MRQPHNVIQDWIERILNEARNLTDWEEDFIESLAEQFEDFHSLSERQEEILERIYVQKVP